MSKPYESIYAAAPAECTSKEKRKIEVAQLSCVSGVEASCGSLEERKP